MNDNDDKRSGTQTIERAVALLREICLSGHSGGQLSELAARSGLRKSTAHRILTCLARERLVRQCPDNRHYLAGPMLFELGVSASPERAEFQHTMRNRLWTLSRQTSGVAFLFYRSGDDFVCAVRAGTAKCKARYLPVFPGTRRPLVLGTGGMAILLALPREELLAIVERNIANLNGGYGDASIEGICHMIKHSYERGFAINASDILPGVNAFSLALRNQAGEPFAAISLAGSARDFPLERLDEYRELLYATAKDLPGATPCPARVESPQPKPGARTVEIDRGARRREYMSVVPGGAERA